MDSAFSGSICACASLRRANRAVCHLYDMVLAPTGLKSTQFIILRAILEAGEIAHCDLARSFVASQETFSRRLGSARKSGWLEMRVDERSRRMYRLTDRGCQLVALATPYWERAQSRMARELGENDWCALSLFAERITRAAIRAEVAKTANARPEMLAHQPDVGVYNLRLPERIGAGESLSPLAEPPLP